MDKKEIYTDNSVMLYGKHRFTLLKNIPNNELFNYLKNHNCFGNPSLREYIIKRLQKRIKTKVNKEVGIPCDKFAYPTEKEAKFKLNQIWKDRREHQKPRRAYECPTCGQWHLTSKKIKEYAPKKGA